MTDNLILGTGKKNFLIIAGVHGDELTPVFAAHLFFNNIPNISHKKYKSIRVLNYVNLEAIIAEKRSVGDENITDLNRMFNAGKLDKKITEIIESAIEESDCVIDIHSSPACTEFALLNLNSTTNSYVKFLKDIDCNYLIHYSNKRTIKKYCMDKKKIAFTLELNGLNFIDYKSASNGYNIISNIIRNINKFELVEDEPTHEPCINLQTHHEGIFIPNFGILGKIICDGDKIGDVIKKDSNVELFYSKLPPSKCIVLGSQYIDSDKIIAHLQKI